MAALGSTSPLAQCACLSPESTAISPAFRGRSLCSPAPTEISTSFAIRALPPMASAPSLAPSPSPRLRMARPKIHFMPDSLLRQMTPAARSATRSRSKHRRRKSTSSRSATAQAMRVRGNSWRKRHQQDDSPSRSSPSILPTDADLPVPAKSTRMLVCSCCLERCGRLPTVAWLPVRRALSTVNRGPAPLSSMERTRGSSSILTQRPAANPCGSATRLCWCESHAKQPVSSSWWARRTARGVR